jgi:hypothetical protein
MKKELKFILVIVTLFAILIVVQMSSPSSVNYEITLEKTDKQAFGTYILFNLIEDLYPDQTIVHTNSTMFELGLMDQLDGNLFILTTDLYLEPEEMETLLDFVAAGNTALITSYLYDPQSSELSDTLNLKSLGILNSMQNRKDADSTFLYFKDTPDKHYNYKKIDVPEYFSSYDTTATEVLAFNQEDNPVLIRTAFGEGNFLLSTTPLVFTNYYMVHNDNYQIPEKILQQLPVTNVYWTNYYMMGRMESNSPLRYILKNPTLSWAYYIALFSIIIYVIFAVKRKQKPIPVISPPRNASLEFVNTVGMLYYNRGDHRNIASKKINYFLDHVRRNYFIATDLSDPDFVKRLANKSGVDEKKVTVVVRSIIHYSKKPVLTSDELMHLNNNIEGFLHHGK